jgi:1-acyl-sn-glycerol-3-phosphate acyltransferase
MQHTLRGAFRAFLFIVGVLVFMPALALARAVNREAHATVCRAMYQVGCRIAGIKLVRDGQPVMKGKTPVLFVSNHSSYLDIVVLGALINPTFVAKHEVAGWAVFGWIAKLTNTLFIRRKKTATGEGVDAMEARLRQGEKLVLFAEGTTSDGARVLPFKSALFKMTECWEGPVPLFIQPVSVTCTHMNGLPTGTKWRKKYSWIGDESLVPHLWQVFKIAQLTVQVTFHPPVEISAKPPQRKVLARQLEKVVEQGIAAAIRGKKLEEAPALVL